MPPLGRMKYQGSGSSRSEPNTCAPGVPYQSSPAGRPRPTCRLRQDRAVALTQSRAWTTTSGWSSSTSCRACGASRCRLLGVPGTLGGGHRDRRRPGLGQAARDDSQGEPAEAAGGGRLPPVGGKGRVLGVRRLAARAAALHPALGARRHQRPDPARIAVVDRRAAARHPGPADPRQEPVERCDARAQAGRNELLTLLLFHLRWQPGRVVEARRVAQHEADDAGGVAEGKRADCQAGQRVSDQDVRSGLTTGAQDVMQILRQVSGVARTGSRVAGRSSRDRRGHRSRRAGGRRQAAGHGTSRAASGLTGVEHHCGGRAGPGAEQIRTAYRRRAPAAQGKGRRAVRPRG